MSRTRTLMLTALLGVGSQPAGAIEAFVAAGTPMRFLANASDPGVGLGWVQPGFDDTGWASGVYGIGYEAGTGAEALLATTVPAGVSSIYTRVTFDVAQPGAVATLWVGADWDDGWMAWLNGVEIYRSPTIAAGDPAWDTPTTAQHECSNGTVPDYSPLVDVSAAALPVLNPTGNVLAVAVWNSSAGSSDLVLVPTFFADSGVRLTRGPYLQQVAADSAVVRWRTSVPTDSVVRFGSRPTDLATVVTSAGPTTEHVVALNGLMADTEYYYAVGRTGEDLAGADLAHRIRTAPGQGDRKPYRIWALGDSGTADNAARRVRDAYLGLGLPTDVLLMLGDNAYDDGTDAEYQSAVFDMYPMVLRQTALWPTFGNHDGRSSDSLAQTGPYFDMFTLPTNGEVGGISSGTEAYYAFDWGNIHFVCLESDSHDLSATGPMADWLRLDLADTLADWIVVYFHHGPYTKGSHDSDVERRHIEVRQGLLPIFESHGVDLVLSGHSHSYERTYLLDGHTGPSASFDLAIHALDSGDGRPSGDGAYTKPAGGPVANRGAVYTVAGSSGKTEPGPLDHPAMVESLEMLGSVLIEVNGDRLDATFLDDRGNAPDWYSIFKGSMIPPRAPIALVATARSPTEIDLAWTDRSSDEDGFALERSDDGFVWTAVATTPANTIVFLDAGRSPGQRYVYRVQATNAGGASAWSNEAAATTPCLAPNAMGNVLLMTKAAGGVVARWQDVATATRYHLYEDPTGRGTFPMLTGEATSGDPGLGFALSSASEVYYRLASSNACGEGPR